MPKYRFDELDDDLELKDEYSKVQKIKKSNNKVVDFMPNKNSAKSTKRIPRPDKE